MWEKSFVPKLFVMEIFGALGNWRKIDERFDETIIKQVNDASCVAAVGEMLANFYGLNLNQAEILEEIGVWSNAQSLAAILNSKEVDIGVEWLGGGWEINTSIGALKWLLQNHRIGAMLRQNSPRGHAVFVKSIDENDLIEVDDPFDQTCYKMRVNDFIEVFSEFIWRRKK